jgi:hypothetical protein
MVNTTYASARIEHWTSNGCQHVEPHGCEERCICVTQWRKLATASWLMSKRNVEHLVSVPWVLRSCFFVCFVFETVCLACCTPVATRPNPNCTLAGPRPMSTKAHVSSTVLHFSSIMRPS